MISLTFCLEMLSDYHVGSGYGDGAFSDSSLFRGSDGLPAIRGTTLSGLFREAAWLLFQLEPLKRRFTVCDYSVTAGGDGGDGAPGYCGKNDGVEESCPLCRLFGSPRRPKEIIISSCRPVSIPVPVTGGQAGAGGAAYNRRMSMNYRTRRADERKVFSMEDGGKCIFTFDVKCRTIEDAALLTAAARMVRSLGSSRRRGRGDCRIHLTHAAGLDPAGWPDIQGCPKDKDLPYENFLLTFFEKCWINCEKINDAGRFADTSPGPLNCSISPGDSSGQPVRVRLVARLDEPLIIARRAYAGNKFETVDFIPGNVLLGALAGMIKENTDISQESPAYKTFVRLFRRGEVCFTPLYPARQKGSFLSPAVPVPLDLFTCQLYSGLEEAGDEVHPVAGFAANGKEAEACVDCGSPLKPAIGFVNFGARLKSYRVEKRLEMHNSIDSTTGRVVSGDLYGYLALEKGQFFTGELTCRSEEAWQALRKMAGLPEDEREAFVLHMGKGFRRGYGRVVVAAQRVNENEVHPWIGLSLAERVKDPSSPLVMILLTDAVLVDPWERYAGSLDYEDLLEREFTRILTEAGEDAMGPVKVTVQRCYSKSRLLDAFNSHLSLPRFREIALVAGSSARLVIQAREGVNILKVIKIIEQNGIGLRRSEGFGRVAFNHPLYPAFSNKKSGVLLEIPDVLLDERVQEDTFSSKLDIYLDDNKWELFNKIEWLSFARLLRGMSEKGLDAVNSVLKELGQPPAEIAAELAGRDKTSFFAAKDKGLAGMKCFKELLKDVKGSSFWNESEMREDKKERMLIEKVCALIALQALSR